MSKSVQEKYDTMMKANNKYMKFSEENGFFDKIDDRLHRESEQATKELKSGLDESGITIDELRMIESEEDLTDLAQAKGLSEELIVGLLKKSYDPYLEFDIRTGIFNRHVVNPAKERLEAQSLHMPAFLSNLKNKIMAKAEKHPNVAKVGSVALKTSMVGLGFAAALVNPIAVAAGFATRYAGKKLFINKAEAKVKAFGKSSLDKFSTDKEVDLEKMEQEYFSGINDVDKYKVRTNTVAAGVALGAAVGANAYGLNTIDSFMPSGGEADPGAPDLDISNQNPVEAVEMQPEVAEIVPVPAVESAPVFEVHEVVKGDTLSEIMLSDLREAIDAGEINLPDRITGEGGLSAYMYEKFPEFTGAEGVEATLSSDQWQAVGVGSGDPDLIYPGETINIQALVDIMNGGNPDQVTNGLDNINSVSVPDVVSLDSTESLVDSPAQDVVFDAPMETDLAPQAAEPLNTNTANATGSEAQPQPLTVSPEDIDYYGKHFDMKDSFKELVVEFTEEQSLPAHLLQTMNEGLNKTQFSLPLDMTVNGVNYDNNLAGYIAARLPELSPDFNPSVRDAVLSRNEWLELGVTDGDPKNMLNNGDTLQTGKLLQFILSGDKSVLALKSSSYV